MLQPLTDITFSRERCLDTSCPHLHPTLCADLSGRPDLSDIPRVTRMEGPGHGKLQVFRHTQDRHRVELHFHLMQPIKTCFVILLDARGHRDTLMALANEDQFQLMDTVTRQSVVTASFGPGVSRVLRRVAMESVV